MITSNIKQERKKMNIAHFTSLAAALIIVFLVLTGFFILLQQPKQKPLDLTYIEKNFNACISRTAEKHFLEVKNCNEVEDAFIRNGCLSVAIFEFHNEKFYCMNEKVNGILFALDGLDIEKIETGKESK